MSQFALTFSMQGAEELMANIQRLEDSAKRRVGRRMVVRSAAVLRRTMRRRVKGIGNIKPSSRNAYARAIISKNLKRRGSLNAALVGPERKKQADGHDWGLLANIFETGAGPHSITAKSGVLSDGSEVFGSIVNHPGIHSSEPLRKGFEDGAPAALREALRVGWLELEKAIARSR